MCDDITAITRISENSLEWRDVCASSWSAFKMGLVSKNFCPCAPICVYVVCVGGLFLC
jgi:hypothetical protein